MLPALPSSTRSMEPAPLGPCSWAISSAQWTPSCWSRTATSSASASVSPSFRRASRFDLAGGWYAGVSLLGDPWIGHDHVRTRIWRAYSGPRSSMLIVMITPDPTVAAMRTATPAARMRRVFLVAGFTFELVLGSRSGIPQVRLGEPSARSPSRLRSSIVAMTRSQLGRAGLWFAPGGARAYAVRCSTRSRFT